jgi:hypothetical protein
MLENRIKTTQIKYAADAYIASGYDADKMRDLMNLLQIQTPYIQKRFWKIVDTHARNWAFEGRAKYEAERAEA